MKKLYLNIPLFLFLAICSVTAFGQAPQSFSYQAVARDASGNVLPNQNISLRISILETTANGNVVYSETFSPTTNDFGLVNLQLGTGTVVSGAFTSINWENDLHFVQVDMDVAGGTNYQLMGTSQLLSVPYALHARTVEIDAVIDGDADSTNEIQDISLSGTNLSITSGSTVDLSVLQDGVNDADADPNNEIQDISLSGTDLSITSGSTIDMSVLQDGVNDADADPTNEIQDISLSGTDLSITSGSTIDMSVLQDGVNDADADPTNEIQDISLSGTDLSITGGSTIDMSVLQDGVIDADADPTNEIELPATANTNDVLTYNGTNWAAQAPAGGGAGGSIMYIYDGQTCPTGWNTQLIGVGIFGGAPVDACWTDTPCMIMYIYDGQTCPAGWNTQNIGVAIINGTTTPVDACYKCN